MSPNHERAASAKSVKVDENGLSWAPQGMAKRFKETPEEKQKRLERIADAVKIILENLGEDVDREGILKTPMRYAKALDFLTQGYNSNLEDLVNQAVFEEDHEEMVMVKNIDICSMCEHHMVPIIGKMTIAYIPSQKVIGLSKLARIAEMFARRLQVQERLTKQVATALMDVLHPQGVAVTMEANHMCMFKKQALAPSPLACWGYSVKMEKPEMNS
ncbi:hypothetical protein HDV04_000977 [Boothiomyces sp. JEL0838]|nr:hypothetical protein HDV04_000977 [Boothiomyces sp. JEL0838]